MTRTDTRPSHTSLAPFGDFASARKSPANQLLSWALVLLLHILLVWLVLSGLGREVVQQLQKPVEVVLLELQAPPAAPPSPAPAPATIPAPAPKAEAPPPAPVAPPVEVPVVQAPPPVNTITAAPSPPSPAPPSAPVVQPATPLVAPKSAPPAAPSPSVRTAALVSAKHCKEPEYPKTSFNLGEEGSVHLRFLLGVDGKVTRSEIERSSGSRRLDEAARAGLSLCQFKPGTVDGKPEPTWVKIIYTWSLD